jgi:hypothetical protein
MISENEFFPAFPVDVRALWDVNGRSLNYAEKAYRAWLEAAGEMQSEAIAFFNDRLAKDSAAMVRLGQCRTPVEILNVQAEYAGHAFTDLINGSQKFAAYFGKAASAGGSTEAAHASKEPVHKRSAQRAERR